MGQWGTGANEGDQRPNWFKDTTKVIVPVGDATTANTVVYGRPNHPAEAENLEATERGWERVVRYGARTQREVVVANRGLGTTLASPKVVDVRWATAHTTATEETTVPSLVVTFSHPVKVTGTAPTTIITSTGVNIDCTYNSGSETNKLTFNGPALTGRSSEALSVVGVDSAASILLGTIRAYDPDAPAVAGLAVTAGRAISAVMGNQAGARVVA